MMSLRFRVIVKLNVLLCIIVIIQLNTIYNRSVNILINIQ